MTEFILILCEIDLDVVLHGNANIKLNNW